MSAEVIVWNLVKDITERVYLSTAPHNPTKPFLLVTLVSGTHEHVLGGAAGVLNAEFQFDAISDDLHDAIEMIESVRNILDGYADESILYSTIQLEQDMSLPPNDSSPDWLFRKAARYMIRVKESIPSA